MKLTMNKLVPSFALCGALALLVGCGGTDTGQENQENTAPPVEDSDDTIVYNGPVAGTEDILQFKLNVWDVLTADDRCGGCHNEEYGQEPLFMRRDDINLAYEATLPLVDKSAPILSRLVERADEGHNAWNPSAPDIINNLIQNWATATGASANEIVLTPPDELRVVGETAQFPLDSALFETTIYALVRDGGSANCLSCHAEDTAQRQQPFFASSNVDAAYSAARTLIDLDTAANSRFVQRMQESHNVWSDPDGVMTPQAYSVQEMLAAVNEFLDNDGEGLVSEPLPSTWLVSSASNIAEDGQVASAGGRIETDVIALYQFKQGSGSTAFDISTVEPQLNLSLSPTGVDWVGSWGLRFSDNGKAQGDTNSSTKLHDLIKLTGEYSIESWVVPGNVTQEESRIVTYSGNNESRNFALMQTLYDYEFLTRTENSDGNGMPLLNTPSADEVLQATLQHVVATYDPIEGRRVYVNGELIVEDPDGSNAGNLNDWDDGFVLAIGNEVDSANDWVGTMRLLAIHNRVLTDDQILANFEAGVGQKYYLFFSVTEYVGYEDAFVVFEVEQYDDSSYLFQNPFFIILDGNDTVPSSEFFIRGMRIGINGKEAPIGQAFANINVAVNSTTYSADTGISLADPLVAPTGTIIGLENGLVDDLFFLTFEEVGGSTFDRPADESPAVPDPVAADPQPEMGIRLFDEIFQNMSAITTVPSARVYEFYANEIRRSLPGAAAAAGFLASQQSAVTQLALAYCTVLVEDATLRGNYFGDYDDLSDQAERDALINPLLDRMLIATGNGLTTSPDIDAVRMRLDNVGVSDGDVNTNNPEEFDGLLQVMSSNTANAKATAVCTSVLASAAMLMQ